MHRRHRIPGPERGRAVASLVLFLALAVAATAAIVWLVFGRSDAPPPRVAPPARTERGAVPPTPVANETTRGGAAPEAAHVAAAETRPAVVLRGTVAAPGGEPIADAIVRVVPAPAATIRPLENDGYLVAEPLVPDHFEPGPLRDALVASSTATTDADGAYEISITAADERREVLAWAPGRALARRTLETAGGAPGAVTFLLEPGTEVRGTIREDGTGEPAARLLVLAAVSSDSATAIFLPASVEASARARSGPDGRYAIVGLPAGVRRVVPRTGASDFVGVPLRQGREVVAKPGEPLDGVDFTVTRGGRVRGVVADASGAPLAGVDLTAIGQDALSASMRGDLEPYAIASETKTKTGADGRFAIRGLPFGRAHAVLASADEFAPCRTAVAALAPESPEAEIEITLGRGSDVSGVVLDAAGAPAPGTRLTVSPKMSGLLGDSSIAIMAAARQLEATADDAGRFAFAHLPAGEYSIRAGETSKADRFDQAGLGVTVVVDGVSPKEGVEVRLEPAKETAGGGAIAGVAKDDRGEPIAGVAVKIEPEGGGLLAFLGSSGGASATTREDGRFEAAGLDAEKTFRIDATRAGHAAAKLERVAPGGEIVTLVLTRSASIAGKVVGPDGRKLDVPFTVRVQSAGPSSPAKMIEDMMPDVAKAKARSATGAPDGTFAIADVAPGLVAVRAEAPGFAPARSEDIALAPGDAVESLVIRLSAGARLRGLVTLADGSPVRKATVTLRPLEEDDKAEALRRMMPNMARSGARDATTGDDGRWEIDHLAPGRYSLAAEHAEFAASREAKLFLAPDASETAPTIVMSTGGTIDGAATEKGKPRAGLLVQVMGDGPLQMTTTDADGKFLIERLTEGEYLVNCVDATAMASGKGTMLKSKTVEVVSDAVTKVEFTFGVGVKVSGRVIGGAPAGPGSMRLVTMRRPGGPGPEDVDPLEFSNQLESARHQAGVAFVGADGTYAIQDVEPGTYILEVPVMPENPLDFEGYSKMDRTPRFRKEITVEKKDIEIDIVVP